MILLDEELSKLAGLVMRLRNKFNERGLRWLEALKFLELLEELCRTFEEEKSLENFLILLNATELVGHHNSLQHCIFMSCIVILKKILY